jgi:hypothetical protein
MGSLQARPVKVATVGVIGCLLVAHPGDEAGGDLNNWKSGLGGDRGTGVLPGLPWRASLGRISGPAPELGADTEMVLKRVLDLSPPRCASRVHSARPSERYSMTSSAWSSMPGGTVRPSALAVFRLITSKYFVGS